MSEIEVTEEHLGWAGSVAQHLCHPADQGAATRLLADTFARYGEMVRQAARERALDEAAEVADVVAARHEPFQSRYRQHALLWNQALNISEQIRKLKEG